MTVQARKPAYKKQNIYSMTFVAQCPSDGQSIVYDLEIQSSCMIMVEHIRTAAALIKKGYHEEIADQLYERFGGTQTIVATHQGVNVRTIRAGQ